MTAVLFTAGKFAIGYYLGKSGLASAYGAAASIVTILLWIYYASLILLFGAEFTKAFAESRAAGSSLPNGRERPAGRTMQSDLLRFAVHLAPSP